MIIAMTTKQFFIACYFIQIPLGLYALFGLPMRGKLPAVYENCRKGIGTMAILPCASFSVILQLIFLAIYLIKVKAVNRKAERATSKLRASVVPAGSSANPFARPDGATDAYQNPFATARSPEVSNPFIAGVPRGASSIDASVATPHRDPASLRPRSTGESETEIVYEIGDWTARTVASVCAALDSQGIAYEVVDHTELVVDKFDEPRVDTVVATVTGQPVAGKANGAMPSSLGTGVPDPPGSYDAPSSPLPSGEWRPDPSGRHEFRYWDGEKLTEFVADGGVGSTDEIGM